MAKVLYFNPTSGISGDMTLGALVDLGIDGNDLIEELKKLPVEGYHLDINKGVKKGITGTKVDVVVEGEVEHMVEHGHSHGHDHSHAHSHTHHRTYKDVLELINASELNDNVKHLSIRMFDLLAQAEGKIHGKPKDEVHFHEVGAVDSIVDIVGTAIGIDKLNVDKIYTSAIHTGTGHVHCQHGIMPVPAPATMELLKGMPTYSKGVPSELVTPTGATILKTNAEYLSNNQGMITEAIGYGLGNKDFDKHANVLRVMLMSTLDEEERTDDSESEEEQSAGMRDACVVLETNIDDMSPEVYGYLFEKLLALGALDVYVVNTMMKKNRPGQILNVLCKGEDVTAVEQLIFTETTTFGVRKYTVARTILERRFKSVETIYGDISIKLGYMEGRCIKRIPEYEDCKRMASQKHLPLRMVYDQAVIEAQKLS